MQDNYVHNNVEKYYDQDNEDVKECLIFDKYDLFAENCDKSYPGLCIYDPIDASLDNYCKRRFNDSCISANIGGLSKCYCISETKSLNVAPYRLCSKLAEIYQPYQNNILITKLINDPCWIGLERITPAEYRWSHSFAPVNYTFWSATTHSNKEFVALSKDGWVLEDIGTFNCAICEIDIEQSFTVELNLNYNSISDIIELEVINANEVFEGVICINNDQHQFINFTSKHKNVVVIDLWFRTETTGAVSCKTLQLPNFNEVHSNILFIAKDNHYGHQYSANITLENEQVFIDSACKDMKIDILQNVESVQILDYGKDNDTVDVLCHLTTKPSALSLKEEYEILSNALKDTNVKNSNLASRQACLPNATTFGNRTLHWPETEIGATTTPAELCVQSNGYPVTRTCAGSIVFGSFWLPVNGTCSDLASSPNTVLLNDLLHSKDVPISTFSTNLLDITNYDKNFSTLDVYLMSKCIEKLSEKIEHVNVSDVVTIVNNIMHFEPSQLSVSQEILNSTDTILASLDEILLRVEPGDSGYESQVSEKLVVQITNLKTSELVGIKLQNTTKPGFDVDAVQPVPNGVSQHQLLEEDLNLALVMPQQLQNDILNCPGSRESPTVLTTVFYDDVLFGEQGNKTGNCNGNVVSVVIPGFNCSFTAPLQIIFKTSETNQELKCASWKYGTNKLNASIHGHWLSEMTPKSVENSSYQICEFEHVTHFSLLVLGGNNNSISAGHKKALDIITAVGCGLSLFGLAAVFVTAIVFKSYRAANGIVLNFAIAMTAQIILLFVADSVENNTTLCTFFGALLHYIVLAQFFWMLTIALLQYQRYVVVFSSPTTHLVLKTCLFSWGAPLLPVIIVLSINPNNYGSNAYGLCYALGNSFVFGVLIPICLILLTNLLLFLRIMISIASSRRIKVHQTNNASNKLQLRLAFMLYSLLGLTWGFGLLAAVGGGVIYSYLFCITATLQGFVLFMFFIILNERTRKLWMDELICCKKSDSYDINSDSVASAMIRRPKTTATSETCTDSATSEMFRKYKDRRSSEF